jgi:hypothetical protein
MIIEIGTVMTNSNNQNTDTTLKAAFFVTPLLSIMDISNAFCPGR